MIIPDKDWGARHEPRTLWPGPSRPGLWMSYVSQLSSLLNTTTSGWHPLPPVFQSCSLQLSLDNEKIARDLYWKVVQDARSLTINEQLHTIRSCIQHNPFAFEPYVVLAQLSLQEGDHESALVSSEKALHLQESWGTAWDKRLSFGAWVAWTRVLHQQACDRELWPVSAWDVNNFGLVRRDT